METGSFTAPPKVVESWNSNLGDHFSRRFCLWRQKNHSSFKTTTLHFRSITSHHQSIKKYVKIFKRAKNCEDRSDFNDFWTKSIASTRTKIWKKKTNERNEWKVFEKFFEKFSTFRNFVVEQPAFMFCLTVTKLTESNRRVWKATCLAVRESSRIGGACSPTIETTPMDPP